jgi:uncharacterized protein (DUF486 family)
MIVFYNKIDQLRKLGDLIAIIIFVILAYYIYNSNIEYKNYIVLLLLIFALFDLIFTIDTINMHGFTNIFKI